MEDCTKDIILVIQSEYHKRFFVVLANAETDWSEIGAAKLICKQTKSTRDRTVALVLAHNVDRKKQTYFGVREIHVRSIVYKPEQLFE